MPPSPPHNDGQGEPGAYETPPRKAPLTDRQTSRGPSAGLSVPRGISNWQRQPKDPQSQRSHLRSLASSTQHSNEASAGASEGGSTPSGKSKRSLGLGMGMRSTPAKRSKWSDTRSMGAESTPRNAFLVRLRGINDPPSSSSSGTRSSSLTWPSEPDTAPTPSSSALMLSSPLTEISRIAPPDAYDSGSDVFGDRTFLPDVAPDSQARYSLEYQAARLRGYEREADWLKAQADKREESFHQSEGEGGDRSQPSRRVSVTGGMAWDEEVTMPSTSETQQSSEVFSDGPAFVTPTRQAGTRAPQDESMLVDDDTPTQVTATWRPERTVEDSMVYEDEIILLGTLAQYVKSRSACRSRSTSQGVRGSSGRSSRVSTPHRKSVHRALSPVASPTAPRRPGSGTPVHRRPSPPPLDEDLEPGVLRNTSRERNTGTLHSIAPSLPDHASAHIFGMDTSVDDSRDQDLSGWEEEIARVHIDLDDLMMANAQDPQLNRVRSPLDRDTLDGAVARTKSNRVPQTPVPRPSVVQRFKSSSETSTSPHTAPLSPISFISRGSSPFPVLVTPEAVINSDPIRPQRLEASFPDKPWVGTWKGASMVTRGKDKSDKPSHYLTNVSRACTPLGDRRTTHRPSRRPTDCSLTYPMSETILTKEELEARLRRIEHYRDLALNYRFTVEYVAF